jgi:hypothetical protein
MRLNVLRDWVSTRLLSQQGVPTDHDTQVGSREVVSLNEYEKVPGAAHVSLAVLGRYAHLLMIQVPELMATCTDMNSANAMVHNLSALLVLYRELLAATPKMLGVSVGRRKQISNHWKPKLRLYRS